MNEKSQNQTKPLKKLLLIALIALIVGHALMYINQRSEWLYEGQSYKKAKSPKTEQPRERYSDLLRAVITASAECRPTLR